MRCRAAARFSGRWWRLPSVVHARFERRRILVSPNSAFAATSPGGDSQSPTDPLLDAQPHLGAARAPPSCQEKLAKKGTELKDEMDSLMDEIDEVLEENAEEFVKNYVQRGGE